MLNKGSLNWYFIDRGVPEEPSSGTEFAASQESKLVLQSRGGNAAGEDEDGDGEQGDGAERGDHDGLLSLGRGTGWAMCSQLSLSAVPHPPISMVPSWQHPLTLPLRVSYGFAV